MHNRHKYLCHYQCLCDGVSQFKQKEAVNFKLGQETIHYKQVSEGVLILERRDSTMQEKRDFTPPGHYLYNKGIPVIHLDSYVQAAIKKAVSEGRAVYLQGALKEAGSQLRTEGETDS